MHISELGLVVVILVLIITPWLLLLKLYGSLRRALRTIEDRERGQAKGK